MPETSADNARRTAGEKGTRSYTSSRRALQAAQTRADVLAAALELFQERGWSSTTLAAIAERAEVAVETVYKSFGSKKALLRAAMETAVVGDAEPVPFIDRPEFRELGEGDVEQRMARGVAVATTVHERSARIWQAIVEAAASDTEVDAWRLQMEEGRRTDLGRSAELILGRRVDDAVLTALWILYGPEAYMKLVVDAGWSRAEYESFLLEATRRLTRTE